MSEDEFKSISKVFFVDETTIKFQPENDEAVIMERVVEEAPEADE